MQLETVASLPREIVTRPYLSVVRPTSAPANGRLVVRFLKSADELQAIGAAVDALLERSDDRSASFHAAYLLAAWREVVATHGTHQLRVLTIEEAGELVAIWPLYLDVSKRVLRHLGCGCNEEYAGLLQAAPARNDLAELALSAVMTEGDLLEVFGVRIGDPLGDAIARKTFHYRGAMRSPVVQTADHISGEAWRKSKSKNFRQGIRTARNRLEKEFGAVETGIVSDGHNEFVDWLFARKSEWIVAHGIKDSWITRPSSPALYKSLLAQPSSGIVGFGVKAGTQWVAGAILFLSKDIEAFLSTHDQAFAQFSPGRLILDGVVDLACQRGVNLDLRLTLDDYKLRLTDRIEERYTYRVALKRGGRKAVRIAHTRRAIRTARAFAGRGRRWLKGLGSRRKQERASLR